MDTRNRLFAAAGLVLALAAGTLTLAAVRAEEGTGEGAPAASASDADALVKSLGDPDFAAREKAYGRLKELGAEAKEALDRGAASEDAQIRWASSRLLGLLAEGGRESRGSARLRFEEEKEEPRVGALDDPFPGGVPDIDRTMAEMRRRMEELQKHFEVLDRKAFHFRSLPGTGNSTERRVVVDRDGERTDVRVGPDGKVTVTLTTRADGKEKAETVEAPDLAALEKDHPGVWEKVKDLVKEDGVRILHIGGAPGNSLFGSPPLPEGFLTDPRSEPVPARGLLGVTVAPLPEVLRAHVKVPVGEGLVVEEVLPGSPAERMGLRRLDILLSVNGIPVSTAPDVRSAVGAVEEGGGLHLRILREGRETSVDGSR